ncbi:MAG TPA: hypothetical protein ENN72_00725 [Firmicutes bacterium]|nr:hypothetical protein [Bacillota bacterium]
MTCNGQPEKVSLYLDGIMENSEKRSFEQHLKQCSVCRSLLRDYRHIGALLQEAHGKGPAEMGFKVMSRLYARRQRTKTALFAASMVILLGAGFVLGNNSGRALVASRDEILKEALERGKTDRIPVYSGANVEDIRVRYEEVNF